MKIKASNFNVLSKHYKIQIVKMNCSDMEDKDIEKWLVQLKLESFLKKRKYNKKQLIVQLLILIN